MRLLLNRHVCGAYVNNSREEVTSLGHRMKEFTSLREFFFLGSLNDLNVALNKEEGALSLAFVKFHFDAKIVLRNLWTFAWVHLNFLIVLERKKERTQKDLNELKKFKSSVLNFKSFRRAFKKLFLHYYQKSFREVLNLTLRFKV